MKVVDCNNHVKSASEFFGPSCAVNSLQDRYNPLGDNSHHLCELCGSFEPGVQCTSRDPFAGEQGALTCLMERGEVAFLGEKALQEGTGYDKDDFELLCPVKSDAAGYSGTTFLLRRPIDAVFFFVTCPQNRLILNTLFPSPCSTRSARGAPPPAAPSWSLPPWRWTSDSPSRTSSPRQRSCTAGRETPLPPPSSRHSVETTTMTGAPILVLLATASDALEGRIRSTAPLDGLEMSLGPRPPPPLPRGPSRKKWRKRQSSGSLSLLRGNRSKRAIAIIPRA